MTRILMKCRAKKTGILTLQALREHYPFSPGLVTSMVKEDADYLMETNPNMYEAVAMVIDPIEPMEPYVYVGGGVKFDPDNFGVVKVDTADFENVGSNAERPDYNSIIEETPIPSPDDMLKDDELRSELIGDGADGEGDLPDPEELATAQDAAAIPGHVELMKMSEVALRFYADDNFDVILPDDMHRATMIKEVKKLIAQKIEG